MDTYGKRFSEPFNQKDSPETTLYLTPDSPEFYKLLTMISDETNQLPGLPPPPITEITMEQEFQLKRIENLLEVADKSDIITVFTALQRQCFVLGNNITQLIKEWPITPPFTTPEEK